MRVIPSEICRRKMIASGMIVTTAASGHLTLPSISTKESMVNSRRRGQERSLIASMQELANGKPRLSRAAPPTAPPELPPVVICRGPPTPKDRVSRGALSDLRLFLRRRLGRLPRPWDRRSHLVGWRLDLDERPECGARLYLRIIRQVGALVGLQHLPPQERSIGTDLVENFIVALATEDQRVLRGHRVVLRNLNVAAPMNGFAADVATADEVLPFPNRKYLAFGSPRVSHQDPGDPARLTGPAVTALFSRPWHRSSQPVRFRWIRPRRCDPRALAV